MKILYIGAGFDAIPQNTFKHIREWICVDYEPCQLYMSTPNPAKNNERWNDNFINHLSKVYKSIDFALVFHDIVDNKLTFTNEITGQTIHYFYNYPFSGNYITPEMRFHLQTVDSLVVKGHAPHASLLDALEENKAINKRDGFPMVCSNSTVYDSEEEEEEHTICSKRVRAQVKELISEYVLMDVGKFDKILYEENRHILAHEVASYITLHSYEDLHYERIKKHF